MRDSNETFEEFRLRLAIARIKLKTLDPFLYFMAMEPPTYLMDEAESASRGITTAATDGVNYYFNFLWCKRLNDSELLFVIVHEVLHMLLLHATRRDSRIHPVWNIACDYVVNWLIKEAAVLTSHVKMPSDPKPIGLCDDKFANMTSEQVYDLLDKTMIVVLWPDLVSGNADDQAKNHGASTNAISKALNRTQEERKKRGLEPSNFERIAKAGLDAKAYWGDCLRQKMTSSGADSYNWARRNKKGIPHKIYLPNHRGFVLAKILFVFDTSGSIDDLFLGQMVAELNQLLHTNPTSSITVITCDTEIHMLGEFSAMNPLDPLQVLLPGGGGTDFRKPFIFAQENYFKQIVYLTDSEGTFPERAPEGLSTVWLLPEAQQSHVPFGDVIRVPIKAA